MKIGEKHCTDGAQPTVRVGAGAMRLLRKNEPGRPGAVDVYELARGLGRLLGRVDEATLDPARAAQLAILRNMVATGRYRPDCREVARKLLTEVAAERVR